MESYDSLDLDQSQFVPESQPDPSRGSVHAHSPFNLHPFVFFPRSPPQISLSTIPFNPFSQNHTTPPTPPQQQQIRSILNKPTLWKCILRQNPTHRTGIDTTNKSQKHLFINASCQIQNSQPLPATAMLIFSPFPRPLYSMDLLLSQYYPHVRP